MPQKPVLDGSKPVSPRSIAINKPVVQAKDDIIRRLMLFLNHLEILNMHIAQYMAGVNPQIRCINVAYPMHRIAKSCR